MKTDVQVAVIGGGIVGASVLYHLFWALRRHDVALCRVGQNLPSGRGRNRAIGWLPSNRQPAARHDTKGAGAI